MNPRLLALLTVTAHCAVAEQFLKRDYQSMNQFEKNMVTMHGDKGRQWLSHLPTLIEKLAQQWNLSDLKPMENLSYNYVLSGFQNKQPIILKVGIDHTDLEKKVLALQAFEGHETVKILAHQSGALLLEQAVPGNTLHSYFPERDAEALEIACALMQKLHAAPLIAKNHFITATQLLTTLDREWNIPNHYLQKARALKTELLTSVPQQVLIHRDLHHGNILQHGTTWVAIDPKGVISEPAHEIAIFICNPPDKLLTSADVHEIIKSRITSAAQKLSIDPKRILNWCFLHAMLAWAWSLEDGLDAPEFKKLAELFYSLDLETA